MLINGVGNLANILFGVCDNNCVETNADNVVKLQQSEKSALHI